MDSEFEAIFLHDNVNPMLKLESLPANDAEESENSGYSDHPATAEETKIGEIFHVAEDHFKFVCVHCFAEFSLLVQFTVHVQQHLYEHYSQFIGTKVSNDSDELDVKPLQLDLITELPTGTEVQYEGDRKPAKRSRKRGKSGPIQCPTCDRYFDNPSILRTHQEAVHEGKVYRCHICSKEMAYKHNFTRHMKTHMRKRKAAADTNIVPTDINAVVQPDAEPHSSSAAVSTENGNATGSDKTIKRQRHKTKQIVNQRQYTCTYCNLHYNTKRAVAAHTCYTHDPNGQIIKSFECFLCHTTFSAVTKLATHNRHKHLRKYEYRDYRFRLCKCKRCGKEFNDMSALAKHRRWHKQQLERQYKCEVCDKRFIERFELQRHMLIHTKTRDFKCEICDKAFKLKRTRRDHMRVHTGVGKVQCDQCGAVLRDWEKLKRHKLMHTGEKPYKCEYCGKCFTQSYNLVVHRRNHTGEYVHYCKPCERGFGARRELRKHNLLVHGSESLNQSDPK